MWEIVSIGLGVFSFIMFALMFHWVNVIKVNSEEQVEQNRELIQLLKNINEKLDK